MVKRSVAQIGISPASGLLTQVLSTEVLSDIRQTTSVAPTDAASRRADSP
jgi:hypothetical protein